MNLLELTARGSLVFFTAWFFDALLANRMQARGRRLWWWVVALAFVLPWRLPVLPAWSAVVKGAVPEFARATLAMTPGPSSEGVRPFSAAADFRWLAWIWAAGVVIALGLILFQTLRASRRWTRQRLCTDAALLELLEDCKAEAGVTAPIGLVLSDAAPAPALLGWLRPRILLPVTLAAELSSSRLRAIFLHELAHFRALDVPLHWLFTFARALHWFNPCVHLAAHRWLHHREIAADETALRWLGPGEQRDYGDTLIAALKHAHTFSTPYGALALGESVQNLKQRIVMITRYSTLSRRGFWSFAVTALLGALVFLQTARADDVGDAKTAAVAAAEPWLKVVDAGAYEQSWQLASADFKKALSSEKWVEALKHVRAPLGKCTGRTMASALYQTEVPSPSGPIKGDWVIAQYDSGYENLSAARETITFSKEADGTWKAAGYFIKPR